MFLICDQFFAKVNRSFHSNNIFVPKQIPGIIKGTFTHEYEPRVTTMVFDSFHGWKDYLSLKYSIVNYVNLASNKPGEKIQFEKVCWFSLGETDGQHHDGQLWFQYLFDETVPWGKCNILKASGMLGMLKSKYSGEAILDPIKTNTLHKLSPTMPAKFHS